MQRSGTPTSRHPVPGWVRHSLDWGGGSFWAPNGGSGWGRASGASAPAARRPRHDDAADPVPPTSLRRAAGLEDESATGSEFRAAARLFAANRHLFAPPAAAPVLLVVGNGPILDDVAEIIAEDPGLAAPSLPARFCIEYQDDRAREWVVHPDPGLLMRWRDGFFREVGNGRWVRNLLVCYNDGLPGA